jgi:hypothetical protein
MPTTQTSPLALFYELSVLLTGFGETDLLGAAAGEEYFDMLVQGAGEANVRDLLSAFKRTRGSAAQFRRAIWDDADGRFGPVARNLLLMWYLGSWFRLPQEWHQKFGVDVPVVDEQVVSTAAYKEGLIWRTMAAHAPGAKPPGFGSWSEAPEVDGNAGDQVVPRAGAQRKSTPGPSRTKSLRR